MTGFGGEGGKIEAFLCVGQMGQSTLWLLLVLQHMHICVVKLKHQQQQGIDSGLYFVASTVV